MLLSDVDLSLGAGAGKKIDWNIGLSMNEESIRIVKLKLIDFFTFLGDGAPELSIGSSGIGSSKMLWQVCI